MIVTPQQAKDMKCPECSSQHPMMCNHSACMGWRWTSQTEETGFCGLSGMPTPVLYSALSAAFQTIPRAPEKAVKDKAPAKKKPAGKKK